MSAGTALAKEKTLQPPLSTEAKARIQAIKPSERFKAGWTPVPHEILMISKKVSGHVQHILLDAVIHATFGAVGNPEFALIKLADLARKSRYTRQAFHLAMEDAVGRGLIER